MSWQFRRAKKLGPLRFTVNKRSVSASVGVSPLRFGINSHGQVRRTVRVPGTGLYNTEIIGNVGRQRPATPPRPQTPPQPQQPQAPYDKDDFLGMLMDWDIPFPNVEEIFGLAAQVGHLSRQGWEFDQLKEMVLSARPDLTSEKAAVFVVLALGLYDPAHSVRLAQELGIDL